MAFLHTNLVATMLIELDTTGNSVGITSDDGKTLYSTGSRLAIPSISTESGKKFVDIAQEEQSATGTPPYIMYKNKRGKKYIGYYNVPVQQGELNMPGAARRIVFFCKKRAL